MIELKDVLSGFIKIILRLYEIGETLPLIRDRSLHCCEAGKSRVIRSK